MKICPICNEGMKVVKSWQVFCSTKCRNAHHKEQRRQAFEALAQLKAKDDAKISA